MSLINTLKKDKKRAVSTFDEGNAASETDLFIDTGSLAFNAQLSGSMFLGLPGNSITGLAGEEATGKTFFALSCLKTFLDNDPDAEAIYFDSEAAIRNQMLVERDIDSSRVAPIEPETVEDFRTQALQILAQHIEQSDENKNQVLFVLDSLGMLSTNKETADIESGKDVRDMTRPQLVRGAFRALTLKCAKAKVPLIVTNHTYQVIGSYVPMKDVAGGGGFKYACSTIAMLTKSKDRGENNQLVGNFITSSLTKSRFTMPEQKVKLKLDFKHGLDKYFGLLDIAEKHGVIRKEGRKFVMPDGSTVWGKEINDNPEEVFTPAVLEELDESCKVEFLYGDNDKQEVEDNYQAELEKDDTYAESE